MTEAQLTESSFQRLLLRFALVPILSLCGFLAVLGFQLREIALARLAAAQATAILLQTAALERSTLSEETGIRGYIATRDPAFLEPYRDASARVRDEFSRLAEAASFSPSLGPALAALRQDFAQFDQINPALLQSGLSPAALRDELLRQRAAMAALRTEFAHLDAAQMAARESSRLRVSVILKRLPNIAIGGGFLIAVLLIVYGRVLFRAITRAYHRQLNETELQRDSLHTTLHSIGDAVMVCDPDGYITMLNPTAEALTGWKRDEAIGIPLNQVFKIVNEFTREPVESPVDKVRRLNTVVALANHTVLIRKDGTEVPIDDSGAPIRNHDGELAGVVLVFRDVAERRRAARLLRQAQERLNSIYNTTLEHIGILDLEGAVLDCNRAALEFAGSTREEVTGKPFWEGPWFRYTPGMPDIVRAAIQRGAAGEPSRIDMLLVRPGGETRAFDFSLSPVFDSNGKVTYLVPEARDISELKRAEQALLQSEKLAAVGRLATSIAHEINNPLEAVTNLVYLARHDNTSEAVERYLKSADHELRRVSVITRQTLRFHKQTTSPEPVRPSELLSTVLSIYEGRLRNAEISVELRHRTDEPFICFAGDVRQVLNNLVGNAIDAIQRNGRLLVRTRAATDWKSARRGVTFTVADTGGGIAPNDLPRIFEPFFTTKGLSGTGLGLWVSKEVVSRHHGSLTVRSSTKPGCSWTVFRLFLPHIDPAAVDPAH